MRLNRVIVSMVDKVFILGSCVSRDAFELNEAKDFSIVSYLARTSFASAFHDHQVQDLDLSRIPSSFQHRMVESDLKKNASNVLVQSRFDWLVIDLIDERFNIFVSDNNEIFTLSPELINNCSVDKVGRVVQSNTDEFFEFWKSGWDKFIILAKKYNFLQKILINKVFWTNKTSAGQSVLSNNYQAWIDKNNMWLDRLYNYIEKNQDIRVLEYNKTLLKADSDHKWGLQSYHYDKPVYLHLIQYMKFLSACHKNIKNQIIHVDYLPLTIDLFKIKTIGEDRHESWIFQGGETDCVVSINITFASNKDVREKDLLHTLWYESEILESKTWCLNQGYICSPSKEIGYFKYIKTQPYSVYDREIVFMVPANTQAIFCIQEFYPFGKSLVLEILVRKSLSNHV